MKVKKVPQRTCLGCRVVKSKKELIRIVRTPDGEIVADATGKKSGRGAYTCPNIACLELTFKGSLLEKALEVSVSPAIKEKLRAEVLQIIQ